MSGNACEEHWRAMHQGTSSQYAIDLECVIVGHSTPDQLMCLGATSEPRLHHRGKHFFSATRMTLFAILPSSTFLVKLMSLYIKLQCTLNDRKFRFNTTGSHLKWQLKERLCFDYANNNTCLRVTQPTWLFISVYIFIHLLILNVKGIGSPCRAKQDMKPAPCCLLKYHVTAVELKVSHLLLLLLLVLFRRYLSTMF